MQPAPRSRPSLSSESARSPLPPPAQQRSARRHLTMYDLPSEFPGERGLPDEYHDLQPEFLSATLQLRDYGAQMRFTGTDMCLYYDAEHPLWHKRPDWFLAVGVPRLYGESDLRLSYVVKDEGKAPTVIVELLSPGTEEQDLGPFYRSSDRIDPIAPMEDEIDADLDGEAEGDKPNADPSEVSQREASEDSEADNQAATGQAKAKPPRKWTVYEEILKVPYYITYSRYSNRMRCFQWSDGKYIEEALDPENPRFWLDRLQVGLGLWHGEYQGITRSWLRWYDASGEWILTPEQIQAQRAEQAEQRAEEERQLRLQLLERLKQQGIDLDQLP